MPQVRRNRWWLTKTEKIKSFLFFNVTLQKFKCTLTANLLTRCIKCQEKDQFVHFLMFVIFYCCCRWLVVDVVLFEMLLTKHLNSYELLSTVCVSECKWVCVLLCVSLDVALTDTQLHRYTFKLKETLFYLKFFKKKKTGTTITKH